MNLARILRFFGLRSRHHVPGRRSRLSIRMSRVFHRPSMMVHRSTTTTAASVANPQSVVERSSVTNATPESTANARNRRKTMIHIPENEPVSLDWGLNSSSNSMDLRKSASRSSSLVRQEGVEGRLLVQRLILEELQNQGRKSVSHDSRSTMMERAQALSMAFLEGRGSELIPTRYSSARDEGGGGGPGEPGPAQQLTHREEKKLRKSVARVIRSEEKKLKKLEKLNRKRAKQYARADEFFEQVATSPMDVSDLHTSYSISRQSESYHFDMEAAESKWRHHQRASEFLSSSLTQYGRQRSDSALSLSRSRGKPPRMEFLFFGGSADDVNLNELEVGHRRLFQPSTIDYSSQTSTDFMKEGSCTMSIKINPTLVRNMPRPFEPRMEVHI